MNRVELVGNDRIKTFHEINKAEHLEKKKTFKFDFDIFTVHFGGHLYGNRSIWIALMDSIPFNMNLTL